MRAIQIFVIIGAVLLMFGLGALFFKVYDRSTAPVPGVLAPSEEESISLPPGGRVAQVVGMDSSGVATLVELPQGGGQLLFFSAHGKLKRRVNLVPERSDALQAPRSLGN
ncbi:MAG: hypothetical protein HQL94_07755 [Magnetococcales bacterium]|nr:hypothetical protein [Magnetococcales bacterium]MBF0439348.1 hypothetical protein [Magnetococcales bacterium]